MPQFSSGNSKTLSTELFRVYDIMIPVQTRDHGKDLKVCSHDPISLDPIHFWWMFYSLSVCNVYRQQVN